MCWSIAAILSVAVVLVTVCLIVTADGAVFSGW
jgi:hypothetical protein